MRRYAGFSIGIVSFFGGLALPNVVGQALHRKAQKEVQKVPSIDLAMLVAVRAAF
jgi:hypothetical protein